jgi:outer membrane protein OmpA-like peptidoglycan-associated protein
MRRLFAVCLLLALGGCALFEPSEKRFVVFFKPWSVELNDDAKAVVAAAAEWAKPRINKPVVIAAYADTEGTKEANAELVRARGQAVYEVLVNSGLPATRISRREVGSVNYQIDSQESRRVVITVGP